MSISKVTHDSNGKEHRIGNYAHVKKFRRNKKLKVVEMAGGKCCVCGYNKCIRNLSFHHMYPSQKSFGLSSGGLGKSLESIKIEMKKCILVCANCHGEIHDGFIDPHPFYSNQTIQFS